MKDRLDYILEFRKRVMYALATMGLTGTLVQIGNGYFGSNLNNTQLTTRQVINGVLVLMFLSLIALTRANKVNWAGLVFCTVGTIGISISLFNLGLDSFFSILYILVIVIAATFISPLATIFFGVICTGLYVGISILIISRSEVPVPADKGANIAILSLVLVAVAALLYGFSNSLGRLFRTFEQQTDQLTRLNQTLQSKRQVEARLAQQINTLTTTLSVIFREQNETSQQQANMVSDVATTTQELDAAARKIADNALSVATVAEKAKRSVEVGQQAAFQGVTSIASMRERVQDINNNMRTLNQQIERISEVTEIIGEIADETNLLALNATIEAAGAREYGRRFAAVADEVQRLSRRASNAVEQIQEMVHEINQAGEKTLSATEQGLREAQVGDQLVGSLTVANEDVIHLVVQTSTLASNIAGATQQQRQASAQIVEVMQRIIVAANELAQAGPQVSSMVETLTEASQQLTQTTEPEQAVAGVVARPGKTKNKPASLRAIEPARAAELPPARNGVELAGRTGK